MQDPSDAPSSTQALEGLRVGFIERESAAAPAIGHHSMALRYELRSRTSELAA